jgi:heme o synthase
VLAFSQIIKRYRELSKSGIVALVLISVLGGYLVGHPFEEPFSLPRLAMTLLGILFLASGSSALNQYQERHIDQEMPRTAQRPLPSGRMTPREVLAFVVVTLSLGLLLLWQVSGEVFMLGVLAIAFYNGLYTIWWKRRWAYAAIPGAIPGALPVLM